MWAYLIAFRARVFFRFLHSAAMPPPPRRRVHGSQASTSSFSAADAPKVVTYVWLSALLSSIERASSQWDTILSKAWFDRLDKHMKEEVVVWAQELVKMRDGKRESTPPSPAYLAVIERLALDDANSVHLAQTSRTGPAVG